MAKLEKISPRIPVTLKRDLLKYCKENGMTVEGFVTKILREFFGQREAA